MNERKQDGKAPVLPPGMESFDQTMRGLLKVPKAELDAEERKYQRRKKARRARRQV
jgi:hypothetical protein